MHKRMIIAAAGAALAVAPAAASAAGPSAHAAGLGHKIVLFKSIGGIKLGMTTKKVKKKLGKPADTSRAGSTVSYDYENGEGLGTMDVTFDRGRVSSVQTFVKSVHTPQGIHIGSSAKALKHAYRGRLKHAIGGFVVNNSADNIATQFIVEHKHVVSIAIYTF